MSARARIREWAVAAGMDVRDGVRSRFLWPKRPERLNIEITAVCDAKCIHCPRQDMDRAVRPMAFDLFKKVVDEAADLRVPDLVPNGYGEILTMPRMGDYLAYVRSKRHDFRLVLNTNGYNMTDAKIELLFEHRVNVLNITIDGATAETAQQIRVGLKTERIEKNIHQIMRLRRERGLDYPKIRVGMILIKENEHEMQAFLTKWSGVTDYVGIGGLSGRLGTEVEHGTKGHGQGHARACVLPFSDMDVWADGKAVLCCEDWNEECVVGDLNHESLAEVWLGPALSKARMLHASGRGHDVSICSKCDQWRSPPPTVRLWV